MGKKLLTGVLLIVLLLMSLGAASQDVDVTFTPTFISISNAPSAWVGNGITGDSKVEIDTVYYANPLGDTTTPSTTVVDGECRFTITNTSTIAIDLTVNHGDFTGGDAMQNSETGANGVGEFGAYSWYSGMTYSNKVIMKTTGSSVCRDGLPATTDVKWGAEVETQSDAWSSPSAMSATMTIAATEDV